MEHVFVNFDMALLAAQSIATYFAHQGYLVSCTFDSLVDVCSVCVHRGIGHDLKIPKGYIFSEKEDHEYTSPLEVEKPFAVTWFRYYSKEH